MLGPHIEHVASECGVILGLEGEALGAMRAREGVNSPQRLRSEENQSVGPSILPGHDEQIGMYGLKSYSVLFFFCEAYHWFGRLQRKGRERWPADMHHERSPSLPGHNWRAWLGSKCRCSASVISGTIVLGLPARDNDARRIRCRPRQSARSGASSAFQSFHGGSRLECLGFFDEREQPLGADPEIYGCFGVLDALRMLHASLEIGEFGLRKFERGSETRFLLRNASADPWQRLREPARQQPGADPRIPGCLR